MNFCSQDSFFYLVLFPSLFYKGVAVGPFICRPDVLKSTVQALVLRYDVFTYVYIPYTLFDF